MRPIICLIAFVLMSQTSAKAQDVPAQISPQMGCESGTDYFVTGVPHQTRVVAINVNVQNYRALLDQASLVSLLNRAAAAGVAQCPANPIVEVFVGNGGTRLLTAWTIRADGQWRIVNNAIPQLVQQDDARNAQIAQQQKAAADAAQKQAEALATAKETSAKLQADFKAQTGLEAWVNTQVLKANPFPYQGKVVGFMTTFQQMTGSGVAMFGGNMDVVASGVPNTLFTQPGTETILAVQVNGVKPVKILGMDMSAVDGTYKGAYLCKIQNCAEFIGPH